MTFKKVILIAFIAQAAYFTLAALAFGKGQLLLHTAAAIVAALYLTTTLLKGRGKLMWTAPVVWAVLALVSYQIIIGWAKFINWTLADFIPTDWWNAVRLVDLILISAAIGLSAVGAKRLMRQKPKSHIG